MRLIFESLTKYLYDKPKEMNNKDYNNDGVTLYVVSLYSNSFSSEIFDAFI